MDTVKITHDCCDCSIYLNKVDIEKVTTKQLQEFFKKVIDKLSRQDLIDLLYDLEYTSIAKIQNSYYCEQCGDTSYISEITV